MTMRTFLKRTVLALPLLLIGLPVQAANWIIDPGNSIVTFKYAYGTDPYEGRFTNVQATFDIDPMSPTSCEFNVTINIADIDVDSPEDKQPRVHFYSIIAHYHRTYHCRESESFFVLYQTHARLGFDTQASLYTTMAFVYL